MTDQPALLNASILLITCQLPLVELLSVIEYSYSLRLNASRSMIVFGIAFVDVKAMSVSYLDAPFHFCSRYNSTRNIIER